MRRFLAILVAALFGLAPLAALFPGATEAQLPACCRRHGTHHCAMAGMAAQSDSSGPQAPAFTAPSHCPNYHRSLPAATADFLLASPTRAVRARLISAVQPRIFSAKFHPIPVQSGRGPPAC